MTDHAETIKLEEKSQVKSLILIPLERKLENIFIRAFHIDASFGELGGTSLDAMHALVSIREEIFEKMDRSILLGYPHRYKN